MARDGRKICEIHRRAGADPKEQTVCASVKGSRYGGESGRTPRKAGALYCEGERHVPGWLSVLSVETRRLADEEGAGGIFKKGLK